MLVNNIVYLFELFEELDMVFGCLNGIICCLYIIVSDLGCDIVVFVNEVFYVCLFGVEVFYVKV